MTGHQATPSHIAMSADEYKKRNLHEHILKLPDSYIGSKDTNEERRWVYNATTQQMTWTTVQMNPGLYKIFDEVLVNARDAYIRSITEAERTPVKHIDITFTRSAAGSVAIRVANDGDGIPVGVNSSTGIWAPELIFGHLLTSNNYDEEGEERDKITGGKNGYGAKLANIFSKRFTVETVDARAGKKYMQTWRDNMYVCEAPTIKKSLSTKGSVAIEFEPDLARFPGGMSADMEAVLRTRVVEMAGILGRDVKVTWNGEAAPANSFEKFVRLFLREGAVSMVHEQAGPRWEVACVLTRQLCSEEEGLPDDKQISFVNGINTRKGGKHVEAVTRHVMKEFCEVAKKKKVEVTPGQLKDSVFYFVNATIVNPSFDSQSKETLTTPATKFGSKPAISEKFITGLIKLGLLDEAAALLEAKQARDAKKTDGKKRSTLRGIAKLTDAEWAGTAKSKECTLILTEGDSAATSAISGLLIVGRERWGVFPLRGKLLNVRDVSAKKMMENEEITAIKKILGLETGKVYSDTKDLRYGRIMIMADQDHDGSHIKGLVMNLLHSEWPSLLKTDFVCSLMTPIIKATKGKEVLPFYSIPQFDAWKEQNPVRGWHIKYYKGLGTSTPDEAREWFKKLSEIKYEWDPRADDSLTLAFSKKRADDRKEWLAGYDARRTIDSTVGHVPFSQFINDELIHFSNADNIRSLPSVMDGLKPSQRKILFGCMKRNLHEEVKVAQLAGYVSEHAAYHHGEASLNSTIVGMAQNFVGSNNINLLLPKGQFGSRLQGGKDASQPRYIFTRLMPIVETLFKKADAAILRYLDDDGMVVEPDHYLPVVPLLAINGCSGIGTGFSTDIPSYDPAQIVALLRARLNDKLATLEGRALDPWWFGFKGRVTRKDDVTWITHGVYTFNPDGRTVTITELPVGTWSLDYKEMLERMLVAEEEVEKGVKKAARAAGGGAGGDGASVSSAGKAGKEAEPTGLQNFKESNNDIEVVITLTFTEDKYEEWRADVAAFEKKFKLTSSFKTTNMHAFSPAGAITKYGTVGDILEAYYGPRLDAYGRRKAVQLETMRAALAELEGRLLFVRGVLEDRIVIARKEDDEIVAAIRAAGVPPISLPEEPGNIKAYEYVLKMRIDRIKAKAVTELEEEIARAQADIAALEATTPSAIWLGELAAFEEAWAKFVADRNEQYDATAAAGRAGGPKKKLALKAGGGGRK
jgi:DNA topoisomerase-2